MADKVQRILQDVLTQSIYLVKKGIFSEGELKRQMTNRERLENNLSQKAIRTTHYLKAIEYEYQQQRIRRYRQSDESGTVIDPKYKRASTKDFTILKRTIRLWDRTMHKYRFRIDLWKQYLAFCHAIKSKKAFYKALTNAIRFNPFEISLWLSGAYYEFEVIKNPWKARKIFHKALKLNKSNIVFWKEYLRFQCEFAEVILRRESALTEETVMKFEGEEVERKLGQIDFKEVLKEVVAASLEAVPEEKKEDLVRQLSGVLSLYEEESPLKDMIGEIRASLQEIVESNVKQQDKLRIGLKINYIQHIEDLKLTFAEKSNDEKLEIIKTLEGNDKKHFIELVDFRQLSTAQKVTYFNQYSTLMNQLKQLNIGIVTLSTKQLCFSQQHLSSFILSIVQLDPISIYKRLINSKTSIPSSIMSYYLNNYLTLGLSTFELDETLKRTNKDYKNKEFLRAWVKYNKHNGRYKDNLKILQTLKVSDNQTVFYQISKVVNQIEEQSQQ